MARTQRYSAEQVVAAINKGQTALRASQILGCSRGTISYYARRYDSVAEALRDRRMELVDLAESGLRRALEAGEPWSVAFTLKTLGKDLGYTERQEITGRDGDRLEVVIRYADQDDSDNTA